MNHGKVSPEVAKGLLALHERIAASCIPSSKLDESINIATWNIREFGKRDGPSRRFITSQKFSASLI